MGWVSIYDEVKLKHTLGIPDEQVVVAYLCIGRVAQVYAQPELAAKGWRQRLNLVDLIHFDRWATMSESASLKTRIDTAREDFLKKGAFVP